MPSNAIAKRPFTFEDMMKLKRVGAPGRRLMANGSYSIA